MSRPNEIQQTLKPLYELRTRVITQLSKAKKGDDAEVVEIWLRVYFAVAKEIIALHEDNHKLKEVK